MASADRSAARGAGDSRLRAVNQGFYDALWGSVRLVAPECFNTWPLVAELDAGSSDRLEVGPGMRPRLPIKHTEFVDISAPALTALAAAGGHAIRGELEHLPYAARRFDLLCALDVIEHVADDRAALAELARVARPGAALLISMPLHSAYWTRFDDTVGHCRRYEPDELAKRLDTAGFAVEQSAVYGMKPSAPRLVDWGMRQLTANPKRALRFYDRLIMPIGLALQKPLLLHSGWIDPERVGEILLVCRRLN